MEFEPDFREIADDVQFQVTHPRLLLPGHIRVPPLSVPHPFLFSAAPSAAQIILRSSQNAVQIRDIGSADVNHLLQVPRGCVAVVHAAADALLACPSLILPLSVTSALGACQIPGMVISAQKTRARATRLELRCKGCQARR
jgi:hypothetical protein